MISIVDINTLRFILDRQPMSTDETRSVKNILHVLSGIVASDEPTVVSTMALATFDASPALDKIRDLEQAFSGLDMTELGSLELDDLISLRRMWLASGAALAPDRWTERQVAEACGGRPPRWDQAGAPQYGS